MVIFYPFFFFMMDFIYIMRDFIYGMMDFIYGMIANILIGLIIAFFVIGYFMIYAVIHPLLLLIPLGQALWLYRMWKLSRQ